MNLAKPIRLSGILSVACLALLAVGAFGQGRYANVYSRSQVDGFIAQLEQSSDAFRTDFRNEVNRSNLSSSTKRDYNRDAEQFENAVDVLRRRFNSSNSWWESRNDVQTMISNSQALNSTMNNASFRRNLERQWNRLRNDVNKLADTYDLPGLNGGGWNGGPGFPGGGGGQGNVPSWAQGTFYGRNPETGGNITLNIERNGRVMISFDGGPANYARMDRTTLYNGQYTSRVARINNGIRTTDVSNGSYIDYYRTPNGGGGGGYIPPGGGNVPNWALGTFQARNPQSGGTIVMTIERNGSVTIVFDNGSPTYASMNGTTLTNGQYVSRISQIRNGIRTTDVNNGSYIDYHRR